VFYSYAGCGGRPTQLHLSRTAEIDAGIKHDKQSFSRDRFRGVFRTDAGAGIRGSSPIAGSDAEELHEAFHDSANWIYADHDYHGTRFSGLDQINTKNVTQLVRVCSHTFPEKEAAQTARSPTTLWCMPQRPHYTLAMDGGTCGVMWLHKWQPKGPETLNTQRAAPSRTVSRACTADGWLLAWMR